MASTSVQLLQDSSADAAEGRRHRDLISHGALQQFKQGLRDKKQKFSNTTSDLTRCLDAIQRIRSPEVLECMVWSFRIPRPPIAGRNRTVRASLVGHPNESLTSIGASSIIASGAVPGEVCVITSGGGALLAMPCTHPSILPLFALTADTSVGRGNGGHCNLKRDADASSRQQ